MVERQALERVIGEVAARRFVSDRVAQFLKSLRQRVNAGISAAAALDIKWRRSEKANAQAEPAIIIENLLWLTSRKQCVC